MVWGADPIALENIFTPEMYCMQFQENTNGRVYGNHERNALSFALYIHADRKQTLMRELDSVGINEKTLFPGLDGIGRYVEQRFRFNYNEAMQCLQPKNHSISSTIVVLGIFLSLPLTIILDICINLQSVKA